MEKEMATYFSIVAWEIPWTEEPDGLQSVVLKPYIHVGLCDPMNCSTQVSRSFTVSQSLLKLKSTESVMPSNYLVLCCSLLLSSTFPSIKVFSNE